MSVLNSNKLDMERTMAENKEAKKKRNKKIFKEELTSEIKQKEVLGL